MKELFFIRESLRDKITYYHLLFFVASLPFDRLYSELALISLCIHTLIHLQKVTAHKPSFRRLFLPISLFLLTVLGTAYTRFYDEAFYEWERQLAFLLFPLVISVQPFDVKRYIPNIIAVMALSCFGTLVYLYYTAVDIIRLNHLPFTSLFSNAFINHNFSAPIDMHATYFSMYIALAAVGIVTLIKNETHTGKKIVYAVILFVLLAGLLQLSSRAVLIAFALIVNGVMPFLLVSKKKRWLFLLLTISISVSAFYAFTRMDDLRTRLIIDLKEDLTRTVNNNTLEPRAVRWNCALELIGQSPVYGHGSGSEVALLKELYYNRKLYNSYLNDLNAHNEYLSMLIKTGIIGLIVLLWIYMAGFKQAIGEKDLLFYSFLVITGVVCFSENIMDANKGIFFFASFYSFFYLGGPGRSDAVIQK
ncbi:MAG: O-antigen ligase family protein [Bacteroidota bacterium]